MLVRCGLILAAISGSMWGCSSTCEGQIHELVDPIPLSNLTGGQGLAANRVDGEVHPTLFEGEPVDLGIQWGPPPTDCDWTWQWAPEGLMYPAYLAAGRESRVASHWMHEDDKGWLWDSALGGHVGILRFGTRNPVYPEGWQLDFEGAAFVRQTLDSYTDVVATDFRAGAPLTYRRGPFEAKFGYYHLSSHIGDEFLLKNPTFDRINYVRDALVLGVAFRPDPDLRFYAEAGWALKTDGGSEPWEFQFGVEYSPVRPTEFWPDPFLAAGGRIREEVDWGGNLTIETGLQWRGETGRLFRLGMHYFNGKADYYQFFREHEQQIGLGAWYDF